MARGDSLRGAFQSSSFHEKPIFHYLLLFLMAATLTVSILALSKADKLEKTLVPRTISMNDFLKKLTSHDEMKGYVGVAPLNIIQIHNNNLANLQSQIAGLDASYIG